MHYAKKVFAVTVLISTLFISSALVLVDGRNRQSSLRYEGPKLYYSEGLEEEHKSFKYISDVKEILRLNRTHRHIVAMLMNRFSKVRDIHDDARLKLILNFFPDVYAFSHEAFQRAFSRDVNMAWRLWLESVSKPTSLSFLDQNDDINNPGAQIQVGIRFLMLEKTSGGFRPLVDNAGSNEESMGLILVPYNPASRVRPAMYNVPPDWIYDTNKETPRGPLSFKIGDYRTFKMRPVSESADRIITYPAEEHEGQLVEKIFIPFPTNLEAVNFDALLESQIAKLAPLGRDESLYFCYTFQDPKVGGYKSFVTKNLSDIGQKVTFAGRKLGSGTVFSKVIETHESKFVLENEPAIFVKVPAMARVVAKYSRNYSTQTMTVQKFVERIANNTLWNYRDPTTIQSGSRLISKQSFFNNEDNVFLREYFAENNGFYQSIKIETYKNFPIKDFFTLEILENGDLAAKGALTTIPNIKLSLSQSAAALVENLYNLKLMYHLLEDGALKRIYNPHNVQVIKTILEEIRTGKADARELRSLIDDLYTDFIITNLDIMYKPKTEPAAWYRDAHEKFGFNLPDVKVDDWHRVVRFISDYVNDEFVIEGTMNGVHNLRLYVTMNEEPTSVPLFKPEHIIKEPGKNSYNIVFHSVVARTQPLKILNFKNIFNFDQFQRNAARTASMITRNQHGEYLYKFAYHNDYPRIDLSTCNERAIQVVADQYDRNRKINWEHYRYYMELNEINNSFKNYFRNKKIDAHQLQAISSTGAQELLDAVSFNASYIDRSRIFRETPTALHSFVDPTIQLNETYNIFNNELDQKDRDKFVYFYVRMNDAVLFGDKRHDRPTNFMWCLGKEFDEDESSLYLVRFKVI